MIGLVMIVRDEAHGIATTLASVRDTVSRWTVLDTGSTDGTQNVVRETMRDVPGELHEGPFGDFATARNRVLDLAGERTPWVLMLDADDRVEGAQALLAAATSAQAGDGALLVRRQIGPTSWWAPLLLRSSARWRYHGRVHEYACGPNGDKTTCKIPGVVVHHERGMLSTIATSARWEKDLELLHQDWEDGADKGRAAFYLGQTYESLGRLQEASAWYDERSKMAGWGKETFEAMLRKARCFIRTHNWPKALDAFLEAHAFDSAHAEPLFEIAEYYYNQQKMDLCLLFARRAIEIPKPKEAVFTSDEVYTWKAHDLVAISAYYVAKRTGDKSLLVLGKKSADAAIAAKPGDIRLVNNRRFYDDTEGAI